MPPLNHLYCPCSSPASVSYRISIPSIESSLPDIILISLLPHLEQRNSQFFNPEDSSQALQNPRTGIVSTRISAFWAGVSRARMVKQNLKDSGTMPVRAPTFILILSTSSAPHLSASSFTISKRLLAMDNSCMNLFGEGCQISRLPFHIGHVQPEVPRYFPSYPSCHHMMVSRSGTSLPVSLR